MAKKITYVYRNVDRQSVDLAESLLQKKDVTDDELETAFRARLESLNIWDDVQFISALHVSRGAIRWFHTTDNPD